MIIMIVVFIFNLYLYKLVTTLAWSPHEHGLNLVCGSMDGSISLIYQIRIF